MPMMDQVQPNSPEHLQEMIIIGLLGIHGGGITIKQAMVKHIVKEYNVDGIQYTYNKETDELTARFATDSEIEEDLVQEFRDELEQEPNE